MFRIELDPEKRRVLAGILFIAIAGLFGFIHMYHVSSLYENDHHFSHLSTMEREMTFRTEMGMYYSYYKRLIEAPYYMDGINELMNDNQTEYPNIINTLQRFNLLPEVVIAFAYRAYIVVMNLLDLQTKECWQIVRSPVLPLIISCEGLGDPIYFYLNMVWLCAGLTVILLFTFGAFISDSIVGGLLTGMCFFYNHSEATRVQWAPPLRESFAYPFLILHIFYMTYIIKTDQDTWALRQTHDPKRHNAIERVAIVISTMMCLMVWQFSQFVLAIQLIAIFCLFVLNLVSKYFMDNVLRASFAASVFTALAQTGVDTLFGSLFPCLVVGMTLSIVSLESYLKQCNVFIRIFSHIIWTAVMTYCVWNRWGVLFPSRDQEHIYNLLQSKFGNYKDFHTLLYTCSAEFDFLPMESLRNLVNSLLMPSAIMAVVLILYQWLMKTITAPVTTRHVGGRSGIRERRPVPQHLKNNPFRFIEPHIAYILLLLGAFTVMALMIMRLKLFFTPHLCIIVSILASKKYMTLIKSDKGHMFMLAVLLTAMSYQGIQNIKEQHSVIGEYLNLPFEELLNWIRTETESTAVFAGPMSLMANVMLSTKRPIVNHPHYENYDLRERTKQVYSVFSRKSPQEVFDALTALKVDYVVLDYTWCYRDSGKGCSMTDLWDIEEPENVKKPPLCPHLFESKYPQPFQRVFDNDFYVVLQVRYKVVEIRPRKEFKE